MNFKVVLEKDEDGGYAVTVPSLPGCISQGDTKEEALKNIREAIELHVESLAEDGLPITKKSRDVEESVVAVPL
ncbi:MAG: type II toxin-antitoxin system HicB family antitoxin [Candidatus Altiarchaeum hamiconexum]|uniref:Type II toxin-antitoxin system HicB family antitoxin n=1 Tax=Candidatus Altarchaeum hamiconexum TaxID=1803513 RepID=A0A8J7YTN4_9ARCH|nr:type II toxin-antitoxin system HicB family antitoxin [Candidatus Altarchaeum hamiconexum]NCN68274.1 type II toxin-antitoxin system HicB family antitoxin [Candidatus Altarchaeum hamiconexum]NCS90972.1 type II toxin-antitoxin system HicB family antitoxin [Candidatus Altarchaeum hamiconexum]